MTKSKSRHPTQHWRTEARYFHGDGYRAEVAIIEGGTYMQDEDVLALLRSKHPKADAWSVVMVG